MKKLISLFSLLAFMTAAVGTSLADSNTKTPRVATAAAYSVEAPKVVQFGGGAPDQANFALIGGAVVVAVVVFAATEVLHHHTTKEPAPKSLSLRAANGNSDVLFDAAR